MQPTIILNDYQLFNIIGQGGFGKVYLTIKGNNKKKYATKCIDFKSFNKNVQTYLSNEISLMRKLNHPNVIKLIEEIKTTNHYYIVMDYCNGGTLDDCLRKFGKPFPVTVIQYFMRQIVEGLKYLHSKRIIHRDIKLENILVNFKNKNEKNFLNALLTSEIKIIDFGLAIQLAPGELANTALGSPINMDPLILEKYKKAGGFENLQKYNEKADIWSLGTICYEMFTLERLFKVDSLDQLIEKAEEGDYSIPIKPELSNEFLSFINAMLQQDAKKRYSAEELSKHDFLLKNVKEFTKPNFDLFANQIQGVRIYINSKNNDLMWDIFNKKKKKIIKNKEFDSYIDGLLSEYNEAKKYFEENNFKLQKEEASKLYEKIFNIKYHYESGNSQFLTNLPRPIFHEFIYGCSTEERNLKYNEIITTIKNNKKKLETKINSYDKNEVQINNEMKQKFEENKAKLEKLNNMIIKIENNYQNVWAPAPKLFIKQKVEKIYDFNLIKIITKRTDTKQEKINLIYSLKSKEIIINSKEVKLNSENKFIDNWICKLRSKDWANIENYYLKVENSKIMNSKPFKSKININKLKNGKGITVNLKLIDNEAIQITIIPELLEGKKYFDDEIIGEENINIYPPFKGKSPDTEKMPRFDIK